MRWMVVAEPTDVPGSVEAAKAWNHFWLNERTVNRFWTRAGAVMEIATEHDRLWGSVVNFRPVRVRDYRRGLV